MKSPCRLAMLGCGAVSELYYAPAIQYLEAEGVAVLAAVFDPDAGRTAKLREKFPHAVAYSDDSFLKTTPLDLALVASPVSFHEALAVKAFEAGLAVLCEKPLAADTAAGERIIAAAHLHHRPLAVGLLRRFYSSVQFTRTLIQNQTLGAVKSFSMQEGNPFDWPARSDSFFRKATAGGGILLDIGVHVLDLVVHWFGEPQDLTYADDAMGGLEANCRMELAYTSGVKGTIFLSRDWLTTNVYIIEFERGTLTLTAGNAGEPKLDIDGTPFFLDGMVKRRGGSPVIPATNFPEAFLAQLQDVVITVQAAQAPTVSGEEGLRSLRLIEHCYKNRKLMEMPWLTPQEYKAGQALAAGGSV